VPSPEGRAEAMKIFEEVNGPPAARKPVDPSILADLQ
jgi:hypothetical protein